MPLSTAEKQRRYRARQNLNEIVKISVFVTAQERDVLRAEAERNDMTFQDWAKLTLLKRRALLLKKS